MRFEIVNPGNTEAKFEFLFPADLRLELEGWADNAELSKSQFDILQVEDNKLFQVFFNLFFLLNNITKVTEKFHAISVKQNIYVKVRKIHLRLTPTHSIAIKSKFRFDRD